MHEIQFEYNNAVYRVEATTYGVDIFKNGKYVNTRQSDNKQTKAYWLGVGVEYAASLENEHDD
jgi:hypothetical protein